MNIHKTVFVLLALLLAGMAIVPMVNAAEDTGTVNSVGINRGLPDPMNDPVIKAILENATAMESLPDSIAAKSDKNGNITASRFDAKTEAYLNNYISPANNLVKTMKNGGYTEDQITQFLNMNGYGWDPKTGASWKGTAPTPEEQKIINKIRGQDYSPYGAFSQTRSSSAIARDGRAGGATQSVNNENTFVGFNGYMNPGSMFVSSAGTFQHVVTTHVGKKTPSGQDDWTEAGVLNSMNDAYARYFTYDNDEGAWQFHGAAEVEWYKNYAIYVTSSSDSSGYIYNIWIDNNWVRSGHLKARQTGINNANEIWSLGTNWFDYDDINPAFQNENLYTTSGSVQWGDYPTTGTSLSSDPYGYVLKDHYMNSGTWKFYSWNV
ncbi:hypothetical protein [Methanoregula formicica]|uniref:Uncharacterized protein n=1 Tax=Methanoregula formicica (strain DSM 22288 / NBRC 105244 / SMSP) TaxID=593750 RepID=L0HCZ1_METFS|nr:hypothetical protein [Methanoregula formicica]AGB02602.1 hypothetical protein Metfor_1572 [Methanoregula formicica SMSP]